MTKLFDFLATIGILLLPFLPDICSLQGFPPERRCDFAEGDVGWKCSSGCLPFKYVCDNEFQCLNDDSDEEEGCQLFPETGCKSWGGAKHVKCPDDRHCVREGRVEADCPDGDADSDARLCGGDPDKWKCNDGHCIPTSSVCDLSARCQDRSDEEDGCRLFPETGCDSFFGKMHERCVDRSMGYESIVCTLPEFLETGECRNCTDPARWRCDNGWCVSRSKVRDGVPDCLDGSDEARTVLTWWTVFVATLIVSSTGMLISFWYRLFSAKKSVFFCGLCKSNKAAKLRRTERQISTADTVDSGAVCRPRSFSRPKEILPTNLVNILDKDQNWKRRSLSRRDYDYCRHLYAKIHQKTPETVRNLYQYVLLRHGNKPKRFQRVAGLLWKWELHFHNDDNLEVNKCWRLHLGSSELYKSICAANRDPGTVSRMASEYWDPVRNYFRRLRHSLKNETRRGADLCYFYLKLALFSVKPFASVCLFYFEHFKNGTFIWLIYSTLYDMSDGDVTQKGVEFEFNLVVCLVLSFALATILLAVIAAYFSENIFEMSICDHKFTGIRDKVLLKIVAVLGVPFLPAFILANHSYYEERVSSLIRDLQTIDMKGEADEEDRKNEKAEDIFREIQKMDYRSRIHARIYSCFRVVHAVVLSTSVIISLVLILIITSIPGRKIMLMKGVSTKIRDFLQMERTPEGARNLLETLDLATDVIFLTSMTFSALMVLTALTRYVYNAKCWNMTVMGQVFLTFYFFCHLISRLTVFVVLFSTAEISKIMESNGRKFYSEEAKSTLTSVSASIISAVLIFVHIVVLYFYNFCFIKGFRKINIVQQCVHVLINALVAVPFKLPDTPVPSSEEDGKFDHDDRGDPAFQRRSSETSLASHAVQVFPLRAKSTAGPLSFSDPGPLWREFPDVSEPLIVELGNLREEIEKLWWEEPDVKLTLKRVKKKLPKYLLRSASEDLIEKTYRYLQNNGFINKRLYNPRRTRLEYFWLLSIHLLFNTLALCLEIGTGGVKTKSGHYFSWDVRFGTFFLGLIFLLIYYKRYHTSRDLIAMPLPCCWFCQFRDFLCCKKGEEPVQAIPDDEEMQKCLEDPSLPIDDSKNKNHVLQTEDEKNIDLKPSGYQNEEVVVSLDKEDS